MAEKILEYLLYEYEQEEEKNESGKTTQPHFYVKVLFKVFLDEYPNNNYTKYNAQLYYYAKSTSKDYRDKTYTFYPDAMSETYRGDLIYPKILCDDGYTRQYVDGSYNIGISTFGSENYSIDMNGGREYNITFDYNDNYLHLGHHLDGSAMLHFDVRSVFRVKGIEYFDDLEEAVVSTADVVIPLQYDRSTAPTTAYDFTDEGTPCFIYAPITGKSYEEYGVRSVSGGLWHKCLYAHIDDTITKIEAALSFDGATADISYREIPINGMRYEFNLTEAERDLIRTKAQGSTKVPIYYLIKTTRVCVYGEFSKTLDFISSTKRTLNIVGSEPIIIPTVRDINTATVNLTGNDDKFVKYKSIAEFYINASASKNATIVSQSVRCGSKVITNKNTGTIEDVESGTFIFSATDSRGQTVEMVLEKELVDYIKLTCTQKPVISLTGETDAIVAVAIEGKYFNGSFGAVDNDLTVEIRHTQNDGSMGDWVKLTEFVEVYYNNGSYTMDFNISGLQYDIPYTFQCRATDKLSVITTSEYTTQIMPIFDWSNEDFNFNVPVSFMGDSMADIVIETGTDDMGSNGTWYWRKWQSGKSECYGCRNYGNMAVNTTWGGLYRSEAFNQSLPYGLFVDIPEVIDISFRSADNYGGFIARHETSAPTADNSGSFIVVRPASATLQQAHISFNIIGRWK